MGGVERTRCWSRFGLGVHLSAQEGWGSVGPGRVETPGGRGGGGGGGGTASLKVGTHCQTTAPAFRSCLPLSFLCVLPRIYFGRCPPPSKFCTVNGKMILQK